MLNLAIKIKQTEEQNMSGQRVRSEYKDYGNPTSLGCAIITFFGGLYLC